MKNTMANILSRKKKKNVTLLGRGKCSPVDYPTLLQN